MSTARRQQPGLEDSRITRAEALARQIEQHIRDEALPDGWRLGTKDDLRERFGVAVGTVNQALRLLENRGLVAARPGPGGGLFVASPSPHIKLSHLILGFKDDASTVADCLSVRNALEPVIAEDARARHTAEDLADLRAILARMTDAVDAPGPFLEANWALHRRLAEISPNAVLRALYGTLMDYIETSVADVTADAVFRGRQNLKVHVALVDAIASRDATRVRAAIRRHTPTTMQMADGE
jgi:DNA-binding FadR family transcriptional regulator